MSHPTQHNILLCIGLVSLHGLLAAQLMPGWPHALVATAMFAIVAGYFIFTRRASLRESALIDAFLAIFYLRYAAPPFFSELFCVDVNLYNGIPNESCDNIYSPQAMAFLLLGVLLFIAVVYLFWPRGDDVRANASPPDNDGDELRALVCLVVFSVIAIAPVAFPPAMKITSINQVYMPSAYFALAVLSTYVLKSRRYLALKVFASVAFTALFLKLIAGAILTPLLTAFLIVSFVYYRRNSRISAKILVLVAVVFVTGYPASANFRQYDWYDNRYENLSTVEKVAAYARNYWDFNVKIVDCIFGGDSLGGHCFKNGYIDLMLQRFAHLPHLARAMTVTPSDIDYWGGASYKPLLFSLVPRAIYPDKPKENLGGSFAREYWQSRTEGMSMNLPIEAEAYLNFGRIGLILCPPLVALIFLAINWLPLRRIPEADNLKLILALPLIYPDGNFSLIFGNTIKLLIFFAVILFAVGWTWRRVRPEASKYS